MTRTYAQTQIPGDERTRVRGFNCSCPIGGNYSLEVFEQIVVRRSNGEEAAVDDQAGLIRRTLTPEELAKQFTLRNPITDEDLGATITAGEAMAAVYSVIRGWQAERDALEVAE